MIDFGGDADDNKCQVRIDGKECFEDSRFFFYQNSQTIRCVCSNCLPEAIQFVQNVPHCGVTIYSKNL